MVAGTEGPASRPTVLCHSLSSIQSKLHHSTVNNYTTSLERDKVVHENIFTEQLATHGQLNLLIYTTSEALHIPTVTMEVESLFWLQ